MFFFLLPPSNSITECDVRDLKTMKIQLLGNNPNNENPSEPRQSVNKSENPVLKHKTTLITTKTCSQHYFLLILISSAPCNLQRRKDIRQTWGIEFALNPRWKTVFLVAQTRNESVSDLLLKEENVFGDLVRAQYYDHYWNQTLKVQMAFEWASMYCNFSFLLKMDDDTFVDVKGLISLLAKPAIPQEKLYIGKCFKKALVRRKGKWNISFEDYNATFYPEYCSGFGIVLSSDVINKFVDLFDVVPKFKVDDVYIGILAEKAGVKPNFNRDFLSRFSIQPPGNNSCVNLKKHILVRHGVVGKCLFELFQATLGI